MNTYETPESAGFPEISLRGDPIIITSPFPLITESHPNNDEDVIDSDPVNIPTLV